MRKILFIDRDGTLCEEPLDQQVDRLDKIRLVEGVVPALLELTAAGYELVMISNQDGLGTETFPAEDFHLCQNFLLALLSSQGIRFQEVLICPHRPDDRCACRKPQLGLVLPYLRSTDWDRTRSAVIGDRVTDLELAENMGLRGFRLDAEFWNWPSIVAELLHADRQASQRRVTRETAVEVKVNLDRPGPVAIQSGIGFLDHMLEQLAKHAAFSLEVRVAGDLHIDDHHSVEDLGLVLGEVLRRALGDKRGIGRYGFALPMDEAEARVLLDLGGRPYMVWDVKLQREKVGDLATEMLPHFFRSLAETLGANLHIAARGDNDHHVIEGVFKATARALRQAIAKQAGHHDLPTTKGLL